MTAQHWKRVRLSEIAEVRLGRQRSPKRATGPHMRPYMRAANVTWNGISLHDVKEMDFTPAEFETYSLRKGDILLAEASGSSSEVGKPAVWADQIPGACFQNTLIRVRSHGDLVPFLHLHFLNDAISGAFARASRGVGIHHLGAQALTDWEVVIPPLGEQRRIIEAFDSYSTRLDDAVATLERVQRNLKRYRASVLQAAVEGRLVPTEAELARTEGRDFEPASALLQRILAERRRRWEESELARMKAKGKVPKDDAWKARYQEPARPDLTQLPVLPEGWAWATVDQLESGDRRCAYGVLVPGPHLEDGVPLVRVGDVDGGRIDDTALKRVSKDVADKFAKTYLQGGEVLLTLVGTIGRTAVVPSTLAGANVARAVGVIPTCHLLDSNWIECWFRSPVTRLLMVSKAHEVARKTLNLEDVRSSMVPLPPRREQDRIREALQGLESVIDASSVAATGAERRAGLLRQAVLKWAFEGRLVDQDQKDEPATVLLARIRAERESPAAPRRSRLRKATTS